MSEYPTYLIHYGIEGQKWGERRFQNEDGTWTEEGLKRRRQEFIEDTRKTAHKVAGIIAGNYGDRRDLDKKEIRKLVNKYKNYESTKDENGEYTDKYKTLQKKANRNDGFNKDHDKLYEWKEIEENRIKDPVDLFSERVHRTEWLKAYHGKSEKELEHFINDDYVNKKINTYRKSIETYLNSSLVKKSMKELDVELKDIYNEDLYKSKVKKPTNGEYIFDKQIHKKTNTGWSISGNIHI